VIASVGVINEDRLRELLTTMGDRFTDDEVITSHDVERQLENRQPFVEAGAGFENEQPVVKNL